MGCATASEVKESPKDYEGFKTHFLAKLDERVKKSGLYKEAAFKDKYAAFVSEWAAAKEDLKMDGTECIKENERNGKWTMFAFKTSKDPYTSTTACYHGPRVDITEKKETM